jgi:hypothetical protein
MWSDILLRLLPFAAAYALAYRITAAPPWLGFSAGDLGVWLSPPIAALMLSWRRRSSCG